MSPAEGMALNPGELLTTIEAAELLRLSHRTLEEFRVSGTGPQHYKLGPGKRSKLVYRRSDLMEWLTQFRRECTSDA